MQIIGVDLHARQQTVAMLDVETGEIVEKTLQHEGGAVREFYSTLAGPVRVGIEATGSHAGGGLDANKRKSTTRFAVWFHLDKRLAKVECISGLSVAPCILPT
jgi:hypothetical protein